MYIWGRNDRGQLGMGTTGAEDTDTRFTPTLLELYTGNGQKQEVIDAAVGLEHTLVLVSGGRVFAFGSNQYGQLGVDMSAEDMPFTSIPTSIDVGGESVVNVSAAAGHSVALTFTGAVYTWGANHEGQLGLGGCQNPDGMHFDPCLGSVKKPTKIIQTLEGEFMPPMKLIAAGGHVAGGTEKVLEGGHSVAVSEDNELYGWGDNFHGQIGKTQTYYRMAHNTDVFTPNKFDNVTGKYFNREVRPSRIGPLLITTNLPSPPPPPPAFPAPPLAPGQSAGGANPNNATTGIGGGVVDEEEEAYPEIIGLTAGSHHTMALLKSGEIFAWGDNYFGQLGLGYQSLRREPDRFHKTQHYYQPEMIDKPTRIEHWDYFVQQKREETIGNGTVEIEYTAQITGKIRYESDAIITHLEAGNFQTIARSSSGNVYIWGTNSLGQLGTCDCGACAHNYDATGGDPMGTCTAQKSPPAPPKPDASSLVAGEDAPPAPPPDLTVYAWEQGCECNCAGAGTCKYTASRGDTDAVNEGKCVDFGANTKCECVKPFLKMQGSIYKMDQPMHFALGVATEYKFVTVAAGGAMFAISQSQCPTDDLGKVCSGIGECLEADDGELSTCDCPFGTAGIKCEHSCPVGTEEDYLAVRAEHNIGKFPDTRYREDTDGVMTGRVCSGHGQCDDVGKCVCEEFWYGERCQHMCPWDNQKRHCSGNGTCAYDPEIQETPYCICNRYKTTDKDPLVAQEAAKQCAERQLAVYEGGWCSYYDADQGFEACYLYGLCGVCEDNGFRHSILLTLVISVLLRLLVLE